MVNSTFKHLLLVYLAFGIIATPTEVLAAHKKTSKHVVTSRKTALSKLAITSRDQFGRVRAQKVSVRLRTAHRLQVQRKYATAQGFDGSGVLQLASSKALIINQNTGEVLFAKNTNFPTPIASITKLMTAMVMLDAKLPQDEVIAISNEDIDYLKGTHSRLIIGTHMTRGEFLQLALMASENRAASTLSINYTTGAGQIDWALAAEIVLHHDSALRPFQSNGLRAFIASEREATFARLNADYARPPGSGAVLRR